MVSKLPFSIVLSAYATSKINVPSVSRSSFAAKNMSKKSLLCAKTLSPKIRSNLP